MSYIEFERFEVKGLKKKFVSQLDERLRLILKKHPKNIHLSFHRAVGLQNIYLVMVTCPIDRILIDLGKECGFPRGFPIIWIPDALVQYFGFYPKFDNDERQSPDDPSEFDGATNITFFKKWSGFLGQLIVFKIENNIYWTTTSKNSADKGSSFVQDVKRLFDPFVNHNFLETMIRENLHLCAECMSRNDQTHGARVLKEIPIITAIGKGLKYNPNELIPTVDSNQFVKFLECQDIVRFCQRFNLPCDSAATINGEGVNIFLLELSRQRDHMTDEKLQTLLEFLRIPLKVELGSTSQLESISGCLIHGGTVRHDEILGDFLEGLVLRIGFSNEKLLVKKYKFPLYTIRTMLLREIFKSFSFSHSLIKKAKNFVEHWCVTEEGKDYWYHFALQAFLLKLNFTSPDSNIGDHIHIADSIWNNGIPNNVEGLFIERLNLMANGTVVICIGPIGCGKSSIAKLICAQNINNCRLVHVDGDELGLDSEIIQKLGKERPDFTRSKIILALLDGNIPVISTGGGVLFSHGKNQMFILRDQIYQTLGINVRIIACIGGRFKRITSLNQNHEPNEIYEDVESVKTAIRNRVKAGQWIVPSQFITKKTTHAKSLENFANTIAKKSSENLRFATRIIQAADHVFGFPLITNNNFGLQNKLNYSSIIQVINPLKPISYGKFGQIRILVQINNDANTIGHITWLFDVKNDIQYSSDDFRRLRNIYSSDFQVGNLIVMTSNCGKSKIQFVVPQETIHQDNSTHITINLGDHATKETGNIVRAMNAGETSVVLSTKNGKSYVYNLNTANKSPCQIRILEVFGI
ncbi:RNA ligase [uncultured virus]|nr:RNA ligase [uncultured virus]